MSKSKIVLVLAGVLGAQVALCQNAEPTARDSAGSSRRDDSSAALGQWAVSRWKLMDDVAKMPDIEGDGKYPATYGNAPSGLEYVVYRPQDMSSVKEKLGVYIWGNGGCYPDGTSARFHLTEIASHGYIAIAPGFIISGPNGQHQSAKKMQGSELDREDLGWETAEKMTSAMDWILGESKRDGSPFFGKIDPERIAVAGYSCGGLDAMKASFDPRVKVLILENSGILDGPIPEPFASVPVFSQVKKDDLKKLHVPVLYVLGGPQDGSEPNGLDDFKHIQHVPVFVADHPGAGHLGLLAEPNGESTKVELDWLAWWLNNDKISARTFTGPDCTLCRDFRWVVHQKGIN